MNVDEAVERLNVIPDYDPGDGPKPCVHTFRQAGPSLLGAHWALSEIREAMETYGVEESGPAATLMHHGLVIIDDNGPVFLETT